MKRIPVLPALILAGALVATGVGVIGVTQPGVTLNPGDTVTITCATPPSPTPTLVPTPVPTAVPTPTATPTLVPTPTATPVPAGLPVIPAQYGTLLRWVGTSGNLGPFQVLTYPDAHIGGTGQWMTVFNRFAGHAPPTVHDGYLDLRATRQPTGSLWNSDLVGTSFSNNGQTFGYGTFRFWARFNIGPGTWQSLWLYDTTAWSATEIDFPEVLENQSLTAHVIGQGAGGRYGLPIPANLATVFHEFKIERRASFVAFSIDGVEVGRINGSMPSSKLAILLDSKVGFGWTGSTGQITGLTPNPAYIHVAAVTVDP